MKATLAFFLVFSLLLFAHISYARNDLEGYWKNMMKDQPMPEAIKDLLVQDPLSESDERNHLFIRDFNDATVESRKDAGKYWRMVMKDEAMPEAIQGLLKLDSEIQSENKPKPKTNEHKCEEPLVTKTQSYHAKQGVRRRF
ncbi:hypothetical protein L6164_031929 [Bauhinia variegata]|uniref:Uncharacterized protein n=1 Tax=Bauhinia variegata TaxID=167791 RepID=A0ACB9KLZ7_BAUVA|nr:hypothetical protein L6164_031929 [Bauhinia variegata]